ncbi:vacuolar iron transporter (VIT) family protein [Babesia bovis T2Bo]|uniref:vacuolar iron transporter (VIT) family protein n=1 Tax=Babesia bovis T2Bo TaxID=484906 RepID=UPI001C35EAC1|nr:vacuolar iron transporter (VIT) family protein [Babesia bovis T2Bo]EDO06163.2 vacuolar iron transporter (VIT) family protein [Babesia bovis T2Bo]
MAPDLVVSIPSVTEGKAVHNEDHLDGSSAVIKVIVFGGIDGILTMFAVVSGCAGAAISPLQTICVTIGTLLASAFSMGHGEFISSKAEHDYMEAERLREEKEVAEKPDMEKKEMFDIYTGRYNFTPEDANCLVDLTFSNKEFFLRHMMVEELGILLVKDELTPVKRGVIMFGSFCVLGSFPLVGFFGYFLNVAKSTSQIIGFTTTALFSILGTMCLGYFKGSYTKQSRIKSAMFMAFNGIVVGLISYLSGLALTAMFPDASV